MRITWKTLILNFPNRQTPAANRQFGASGGVVSWDTSQEFGSLPPVRALPIPPPDAKLLKRCRQFYCVCHG